MIARDRAYVHHDGFRWISHSIGDTGKYFWRIRPRWINSGNTPTRNLTVHVDYELRDNPLPEDFLFSYKRGDIPTLIAPHGAIESQFRDVTAEDLALIKDGRKFFYVWGTTEYRDVFPGTPNRITKFCVEVVAVTGDPSRGWHGEHNPLDIRFNTYHQHNCADEDCS